MMLNQVQNSKEIPKSQNLLHLELRTSYFPQGLVEVAEQVETSYNFAYTATTWTTP